MWPTERRWSLASMRKERPFYPGDIFEVSGSVVPQSVEDWAEKTQHGQNPWARYRTHDCSHGPAMSSWNGLQHPRRDPKRDKAEKKTKNNENQLTVQPILARSVLFVFNDKHLTDKHWKNRWPSGVVQDWLVNSKPPYPMLTVTGVLVGEPSQKDIHWFPSIFLSFYLKKFKLTTIINCAILQPASFTFGTLLWQQS